MKKYTIALVAVLVSSVSRPEMGWTDFWKCVEQESAHYPECIEQVQKITKGEPYVELPNDQQGKVDSLTSASSRSPVFHSFVLFKGLSKCAGFPKLYSDKYIKHASWYGRGDDLEKSFICNNVVFPVVDIAVGYAMDKNKVLLNAPFKYKKFVVDNGRLVVAAAVTRVINVGVTQGAQGITTKNVKQFAGDVVMQVGSNAAEEFVVNPLSEYLFGSNSTSCQVVKFMGNGMVVCVMCEFANYMVGK